MPSSKQSGGGGLKTLKLCQKGGAPLDSFKKILFTFSVIHQVRYKKVPECILTYGFHTIFLQNTIKLSD